MKLYKTKSGVIVFHEDAYFSINEDWDRLINTDNLYLSIKDKLKSAVSDAVLEKHIHNELLPPIGQQEVWAAGVTYLRSRDARMDESKKSGAAAFYDLVYEAERPEIFFKSTAARVSGHGDALYIRKDSAWNVPEPELTLFITSSGKIGGYTVGNDMSSRSIEGENPLYLPQAKTYQRSAAIGPCLYVSEQPIAPETLITMEITRDGLTVFSDSIAISKMKRKHDELVSFLYREMDFPSGCFLMTGTCLVPPDDFTLAARDVVNITIDNIGLLTNVVGVKP